MKYYSMLIKFCFAFSLLTFILTVYRQETFKIFDKFYLIDTVKYYSYLSLKHLKPN